MALQEDPSKYFGSVDYFRNKDEQRRTVNDMRREERNKRIIQQGLTRNIKKAIREGKDPRGFISAAEELGLNAAGGGGLGQEASQRDAELRARAASLFEGVQAQKSKAEGTIGGVPTPSGGIVSPTPAINQEATQKPQGTATTSEGKTIPAIPFVGPPAPNAQQSQVVASTKPAWWDDVQNDRTFKPFKEDWSRFAGKTREEARQMIMSQKARNAMRGFDRAGQQLVVDEKQVALDRKNSAILGAIDKDEETQKRIEQSLLANKTFQNMTVPNATGTPQSKQEVFDEWQRETARLKYDVDNALISRQERNAKRELSQSPKEWMKFQTEGEIARDAFYANEYQKNYADALKRVRSERYANEQFELGQKENEMQRTVDTQINKTLNPYS
jgi:hypothetical protein